MKRRICVSLSTSLSEIIDSLQTLVPMARGYIIGTLLNRFALRSKIEQSDAIRKAYQYVSQKRKSKERYDAARVYVQINMTVMPIHSAKDARLLLIAELFCQGLLIESEVT